ncbi:MAG: phosphate ABC transporter permease PstA [Acidobacteriota bacterium]
MVKVEARLVLRAPESEAEAVVLAPHSVDATSVSASRQKRPRNANLAARGDPYVWLTGCGLAVAALMIAGLLLLVFYNGVSTFWPKRIVELTLTDGSKVLGELSRWERYKVTPEELNGLGAAAQKRIAAAGGWSRRYLVRTGNFDLYGDDFKWVEEWKVARQTYPGDAWMVERTEWGPAIGYLRSPARDGVAMARGAEDVGRVFSEAHRLAAGYYMRIRELQQSDMGEVNYRMESARLRVRKAAREHGEGSAEHRAAAARAAAEELQLEAEYRRLDAEIQRLRAEDERLRAPIYDATGRLIPERPSSPDTPMLVSQIIRAYPANQSSLFQRIRTYVARWAEFLAAEPREANTEGGVMPAIFGTVLMTLIMSVVVAPFGVIAALYLREYARQGPLVSAVRIAVNNLAGVPSIVFGVFGLGFFCYLVGARIDSLFYPEKLPAPTYGTGGILWASLTLALLTVPVVIVATEEAVAAVPRSMREGSYACGASKWQTIWRIVLPRATPGIMTGLILAMARGAGEVAPLMLTGVVKLAPQLPFDSHFPFFHLERSFMHLGFHIYDVGFQSRNSEAGKAMVFTTTLLLIALIAVLNFAAIRLRARLKRKYRPAHF